MSESFRTKFLAAKKSPFFTTPWSVLQGITKYHNKRETFFILSRDYGEKKFLWKFHQFKPYNRIFRNSFQSFQIAPWLFQPISCKWRNSRFWHNFTALKNHENISKFLPKMQFVLNDRQLSYLHQNKVNTIDWIFFEKINL